MTRHLGGITSALIFIKLTQRTGCAMNWSFGNQLQRPGSKAVRVDPGQGTLLYGPPCSTGRFLQQVPWGQSEAGKGGLWALTPHANSGLLLFYHMRLLVGERKCFTVKINRNTFETTKKDDYIPFGIIIIINTLEHSYYTLDTVLSTLKISHLIFFI